VRDRALQSRPGFFGEPCIYISKEMNNIVKMGLPTDTALKNSLASGFLSTNNHTSRLDAQNTIYNKLSRATFDALLTYVFTKVITAA